MIFSKKPKPQPTRAERAAEYRRKIAEAVFEAHEGGVDIYELVSALTQRADLLRAQWAATAPLNQQRIP